MICECINFPTNGSYSYRAHSIADDDNTQGKEERKNEKMVATQTFVGFNGWYMCIPFIQNTLIYITVSVFGGFFRLSDKQYRAQYNQQHGNNKTKNSEKN